MSDAPTRLEITPRIVDLGDRVIQLNNVASAAIGTVHPWRGAAKLALTAAAVLGLAELLRSQLWTGGTDAPLFSAIAALGLVALAAAIGLFLYRKRLLVISMSDGQSAWVHCADADFLRLVLETIRQAMTSADPDFRASIDMSAMTISGAVPAAATEGPVMRAETAGDIGWADEGPQPALPHVMRATDRDASELPSLGAANGAATQPSAGPSFAEAMLREARSGLAVPAAAPAERSNGRAEVEDVIRLIDRAMLPHKAELNALLEPVRDHLTGGRTRRSDAVHNWQLFHDYAGKYLTDVTGLAEGCRRVEAALR